MIYPPPHVLQDIALHPFPERETSQGCDNEKDIGIKKENVIHWKEKSKAECKQLSDTGVKIKIKRSEKKSSNSEKDRTGSELKCKVLQSPLKDTIKALHCIHF
jgi:hypothetical protein